MLLSACVAGGLVPSGVRAAACWSARLWKAHPTPRGGGGPREGGGPPLGDQRRLLEHVGAAV